MNLVFIWHSSLELFDESTLDHFGSDNNNDNENISNEGISKHHLLNNTLAVPIDLPHVQFNVNLI